MNQLLKINDYEFSTVAVWQVYILFVLNRN